MRDAEITRALAAWYRVNARELPWRIGPAARDAGVRPDPYRVWLSEVMLQQTTVATVRERFRRFLERWPTVEALAAADLAEVTAEWAGLGYYARARNLWRCARHVAAMGGFPETIDDLRKLPGIGRYTAGAVSAIAFDRAEVVVDGNVERVVARLFAVETPLPAAKPELIALATRLVPAERAGDHAQAMMDLGATICTPRSPACGICPVMEFCDGRAQGLQRELPRKAPKREKPLRRGYAYLARRADGAWLLERRAERGLLGGMLGWPVSDWSAAPAEAPPLEAHWRDPGAEVRHTFTHFNLILALRVAEVPQEAVPSRGEFYERALFSPAALPTVMRKAYDLAASSWPGN